MPQPFRDLACPACGSAPLRELGVAGRMVCDHCSGMMLATADFESSLHSTSGAIPRLVVEERTMRRCPRCSQILMSAEIVCGGTTLPQAVNACERHGVWLDAGMLEAILEELGRDAHSGVSVRGHGGVGGPARSTGAEGLAFAVGATSEAFSNRAEFVRWWDHKPRPRITQTPFASMFRAGALGCPVCALPLELHGNLWGCHGRHGVFVENAALESLVSAMVGEPWQLDRPHGTAGVRACPACAKALVVEELEGVTVDRCAAHGTWFDPTELEDTLAHAGDLKRRGLTQWLRHLFE